MESDHHTPCFFTTMVESQRAVTIPPMFLQFLQEDFSNTATLISPSEDTWTIGARSSNGKIKLREGWKKFCQDNHIGPIDVLHFSYVGNMKFRVEIFEPTGVKKNVQVQVPSASSPVAPKTSHGASSKRPRKKENASPGNRSSVTPWPGLKEKLEDYLTGPKNPYFQTEVTQLLKGNKLFFPSRFLKEQGVKLASEITYSDPAGRELKGKVGEWGDGRVYVTGWKSLVKCNKLETGNKCIIELVMPSEGTAAAQKICRHMNVHFLLEP